MARFAREVAFARRSGLAWIPSVSPAHPLIEAAEQERDRDLCFSCEADRAVLFAKLDAFWDIGVRQFMVSFDDTLQVSTHPEDAAAYGAGPFSYGVMNADLLNRVWDRYAPRSPDFQLITVPADYFGTTTTPYLEGFRSRLREEVVVMWTGVMVVSPTISCTEAEGYARAVGRKPLLWDNYPVNDYAPDKLLIGPYAGRAPDLPRCLSGILSNPANQVRANRIPLYTVADYLRDPAGYDKERSFAASLDEFAAGQRDLLDPFILNVRSSPLDRTEAPRFTALRDAFLAAMGTADWPRAHDALAAELRAEQATPAALRTRFADKAFVAELDRATTGNPVQGYDEGGSWLDRLAFNATNGLEAADAVAATRPRLEVRLDGRTLRGRVLPSATPQEAAAALEEPTSTATGSTTRSARPTSARTAWTSSSTPPATASPRTCPRRLPRAGRPPSPSPGGTSARWRCSPSTAPAARRAGRCRWLPPERPAATRISPPVAQDRAAGAACRRRVRAPPVRRSSRSPSAQPWPRSAPQPVAGRGPGLHALEPLVDVKRRLGRAQEQVAVGPQHLPHPGEHLLLGAEVEVDEDVAQHHDVEARHRRPGAHEVQHPQVHHPADLLGQPPVRAVAGEVADQQRRRQAPVHLQLGVPGGGRSLQDLAGQVGAEDPDVPTGDLGEAGAQEHRQRVRLLPRRAGGRPEREAALGGTGSDERREQVLLERDEGVDVAEERRLVRGHRLDHLGVEAVDGGGPQPRDERRHAVEAVASGERGQTGLDEVALRVRQHDGRLAPHEVGDVAEVQGAQGGGHRPASAADRDWTARPTPARAPSTSATRSRGTTSSARPARTTAPGMPHTTLVRSSCARTVPPAARISSAPRRPSCPMPVRTSASAASP
jgi:hypothetical protein